MQPSVMLVLTSGTNKGDNAKASRSHGIARAVVTLDSLPAFLNFLSPKSVPTSTGCTELMPVLPLPVVAVGAQIRCRGDLVYKY